MKPVLPPGRVPERSLDDERALHVLMAGHVAVEALLPGVQIELAPDL
jgi:hypothetical protein